MNSFKQYLAENKKQYAFRIKLACECTKEQMDAFKTALARYDVAALSEPKNAPIAETHAGFEHLKNIPLTVIDLITNYPANPVQIREMIRDYMNIHESMIMVRTPGEEAAAMPVVPVAKEGQAVLTQDYEAAKKKSMLADLDALFKDHKSIEYPFASPNKEKAKTTNDITQGSKSPLGSNKA